MSTTIYATFLDATNAERAAGALLDYGVRPEDVSVVRKDVESASNPPRDEPAAPQASQTTAPRTEGVSGAAYGDAPATETDRFGADAVGIHENLGAHGPDAQGLASEPPMRSDG